MSGRLDHGAGGIYLFYSPHNSGIQHPPLPEYPARRQNFHHGTQETQSGPFLGRSHIERFVVSQIDPDGRMVTQVAGHLSSLGNGRL
jgi:hypothetical protein